MRNWKCTEYMNIQRKGNQQKGILSFGAKGGLPYYRKKELIQFCN